MSKNERSSSYPIVALGAAVAIGCFITTFQLSAASVELVPLDRALKGDRLPIAQSQVIVPIVQPKLPEECLAHTDGHTDIFAEEVPGRCTA